MQKSSLSTVWLHLVTIFFVITNVSNFKVAGFANVMPLFDVMAIFYFAVFKQIFGIWFVFLVGIWSDALNENLLGSTSLTYILLIKVFLTLNNRMLIRENFRHIFEQFVIFCFFYLFIKWAIVSVVNDSSYNIIVPMIQFFVSSVIYVLMHKFFDFLSEKLLK